jgi:serine/tyrosine/threonine adenylyltransferase
MVRAMSLAPLSTSSASSGKYQPAPVFLELGPGFADPVEPARFPEHILRFRNDEQARRVGLDSLSAKEWENHFALFEPLPGNLPQPLALRYHGHQFQTYNPDLGDGRGFLFAQLRDSKDGRILDLGTKGSGQTPYSRRGDGRLTLKGAMREALATEMLEALGVDTSKTFTVFETGEALHRGDEPSPTRSAVLTRLSHSHIRFGTFQRLAAHKEKAQMEKLVEYSLRNYFAGANAMTNAAGAVGLLREVALRSADLCASWMLAGFVHGVLNTDNMNITGESFDYGPYRFLPIYDLEFTAAYFDQTGLYAYGRQPESVLWNLEQLALALTLVNTPEELTPSLQEFAPAFNRAIVTRLLKRLGLESQSEEHDGELFTGVFGFLASEKVPFEQFFFDWYGGGVNQRPRKNAAADFYKGEAFDNFRKSLEGFKPTREAQRNLENTYFANPKPCTFLIDEIESIWQPIDKNDDWSRFETKIEEIRKMRAAYRGSDDVV